MNFSEFVTQILQKIVTKYTIIRIIVELNDII